MRPNNTVYTVHVHTFTHSGTCMYMYTCIIIMLMRDAKGKKKEAIKVIQTNTAHPRQSTPHVLYITQYMIT